MTLTRRSALLGTVALTATGPAGAQSFPSKPVRIVVPYPPGGGADTTARLIGPKLQEALGETVVVDNRPGAGGMIGDDTVAKAPPDGHTLLIGAFAHAVNPALYPKMPFKTPDDFAPISLLVTVPELLVITPSHPAKNVAELVAMAKAEPGKLSYASSGNGSAQHLAAELFKLRTGTDIQHVPYKGGSLAVADVAAALDDVLQGVANGELTPSEAASIADLIRSYASPIVQTEQARIVLEQKKLGQH